MNKVILITIDGCTRCQKAKESLKSLGIVHATVPCEQDPSMCDELEEYTRTMLYPMVIVKDTNNINYLYFAGNDYIALGKENKVKDNLVLCPQFSVEEIVNSVKEKLQ